MTEQDDKAFTELINNTAAVYQHALTAGAREMYYSALKDFDIEQVQRAFSECVQTSRFFPRPAELREMIEGNPEDAANQAWASLLEASDSGGYPSARFFDAAQCGAMLALFSGWVEFCRTLHEASTEMLAHYAKSFKAHYLTMKRQQREVELYQLGQAELDLRRRGGQDAARMPQMRGEVLLIGRGQVKRVAVCFETATGLLEPTARAAIVGNDRHALRAYITGQATSEQQTLAAAMQRAQIGDGGRLRLVGITEDPPEQMTPAEQRARVEEIVAGLAKGKQGKRLTPEQLREREALLRAQCEQMKAEQGAA